MSKIKICFVLPYSYPLLNPDVTRIFGGAEVRAITFAKVLAEDADFDVTVIVKGDGQTGMEQRGRIKVLRSWSLLDPFPVPLRVLRTLVARSTRFPYFTIRRWEWRLFWLLPRAAAYVIWNRTVQAARGLRFRGPPSGGGVEFLETHKDYRKVGAEIFCTFGVSELSADLSAFCRREHRTFVLFLASEYDLSDFYRPGSKQRNMYGAPGELCYESIVTADAIVVQTETQRRLLKERFARDGVIIRNPVDLASSVQPAVARDIVLWVGKADSNKRPEALIELARRFPDHRFVLVLNLVFKDKFAGVLRNAPSNVTVHERLSYAETEQLFGRAVVFVNTSRFEGFPNTFLQAGKFGVPILSLCVNPDEFITEHLCGVVADDSLENFVEGFRKLVGDPSFHCRCATNVSAYVREHHEATERLRELKSLLQALSRKTQDGAVNDGTLVTAKH